MRELYRYLELKAFNDTLQKECIRHLLPLSTRTDRGILIAEELLKYLHQQQIIIPGIDVLERTCAEAMTLGDKAVYTTLNAHLDITHKSALDALLVTNEKQISRLTWLLQPPGKINGKNILQHIDRLNAIEALALPEGVERSVHQNRLLKLAREGRRMSSRDLADFSPAHRYATMVCVLTEARATIIDEITELHERIPGSMFSRAKHQQAQRLQKTGKLIRDMYRKQLRKVPPSAPLDFIPESWRRMVVTPSGIDRQYYEGSNGMHPNINTRIQMKLIMNPVPRRFFVANINLQINTTN